MKAERRTRQGQKYRDKFRGCLIGGAVGDALGYPVEFLRARGIFDLYGPDGIRDHIPAENGKALISDDTQMTLFTATGLLLGKTRAMMRGDSGELWSYPGFAYKTWRQMQMGKNPEACRYSWLADVKEMGEQRAPGITCMSVIASGNYGTIDKPVNDSKGCGGIMRVAPVGLYFNRASSPDDRIRDVWEQAAGVAALTHGHEMGWLPAAVLAHIINRLCYTDASLVESIRESQDLLKKFYGNRKHTDKLVSIIDTAVSLTGNDASDLDNIKSLGEGWVAEETLAIAIYCSVKYGEDFSRALCVSVNHDGDSDSTGAVTGNILGTLYGCERIPAKWKADLECRDVVLEVADDLCHDCQIAESGSCDENWERKYLENRR